MMKKLFAISNVVVVGTALLMIASLLSYQPLTTQSWVLHTQQVYRHLQDVQIGVTEGEAAQRGYLITGNDDYLRRLGVAKGKTDEALYMVTYMTKDNREQQARISEIHNLIDGKFRDMNATVEIRKKEGSGPAFSRVKENMAKRNLERIIAAVNRMMDAEDSLLISRDHTAHLLLYTKFAVFVIVLVRDAIWFAYSIKDEFEGPVV